MPIASSPPRPFEGPAVYALTVGWMTLPLSYFLGGEEGKIRFPITAFLIDHPAGMALFDTGLGPRFVRPAGTPAKGLGDIEEDGTIDARLRAIGRDPANVRWILCSHLHLDHAGGFAFLPNATVIVQAEEFDYAMSGSDLAYHPPEFNLGHQYLHVKGEHDVFGDGSVMLFPTPGHTPGHQSARVKTGGKELVLASDCCNLKRSLDHLWLPGTTHDADAYLATLKGLSAMRARGSRIFYSHDPDFWAAVPQGVPLV